MERRWRILPADEGKVQSLQQALRIHPAICRILVHRGIDTFDAAKDFFRPRLDSLHDPWLMKDMEKAVDRIIKAIDTGEKILVYGDYDVDGTTSVAVMYSFLKQQNANADFYLPHRYREGYGVSRAGIEFAASNGFSLVISLDCGIKSVDLIAYAATLGIDFIVCDHHLPDKELPDAVAILNPKQSGCEYPYKELCGCGVGLKLITALAKRMDLPAETYGEWLDLVATAIAADIVPMTGENRVLAYYGIKKANSSPNKGISALAKLSGLTKELLVNNLVFMIAPRVNAAGRMDDARKAVQMFIASSQEEALSYAELLHGDNTDRKEADSSITEEALALINSNESWKTRNSTVVFQPHWHKGVVGIVASRLIEHYYRPTVVLTRSGDYVAGSARSVPGFNLYEAIHACREHLIGYGGHFAAAGLTLKPENVDAFSETFEAVVSSQILPEQLIPEIRIDTEIRLKDLTPQFYNIICQMEPFGPENPRPIFILRALKDTGWSRIVKEDHLRFSLKQDDHVITGIGFNMAKKFPVLANNKVDVVCTIDENEWEGKKSMQLRVIDFKASVQPGNNTNEKTLA
jgi:single-stranded-DNA-specific exonuclease